jgi:asparagine synthase (glutamine-hydrolysing)
MIDDIAVKVDRARMANGLESRVPLLDHPVSLKAYEAPLELHLQNNDKKHILKTLLEMFVPRSLFNRTKQGFSVPLNRLLNENKIKRKIYELSEANYIRSQDIFNYKVIHKILKKHYSSNNPSNTKDFVWNYFMFQLWYDKYIKERS